MRLTYIGAIVCFAATSVAGLIRQGGPQLTVDNTSADLGTLYPGQTKSFTVRIGNTGNANLVVDAIRSSCSCTIAAVDKAVILPGGSFDLGVSMKAGDIPGNQRASIYIHTNQDASRETEVTVKAFVDPVVNVTPNRIDVGMISQDSLPLHATLHIKPLLGRRLVRYSVETDDKKLSVDYRQSPDGDSATAAISLKRGAPVGPINSSITVVSNGLRLSIPVVGQITGNCHSDPNTVFWGRVSPHEAAKVTLRFVGLTREHASIGIKPLEYSRLFECKWVGKSDVVMTLKAGAPAGRLNALVSIAKNGLPVLQVPIYAVVDNG
jgi:hypothetical protein